MSFADQLRDKGYDIYDAIVEAGKVRLRPYYDDLGIYNSRW
ncbi:hypothetical protein MGSAQ_000747, partial [marine sediment metagenome]